MKSVLLTDQEIAALAEFLDLGVRSQGVRVAQAGLQLLAKLQAAADVPEVSQAPEAESCD